VSDTPFPPCFTLQFVNVRLSSSRAVWRGGSTMSLVSGPAHVATSREAVSSCELWNGVQRSSSSVGHGCARNEHVRMLRQLLVSTVESRQRVEPL
jgi:hypothetical protein